MALKDAAQPSQRLSGDGRSPGVASHDARMTREQVLALAVVFLGILITAVDTTIVVLGLPVMMSDLHAQLVSVVWIIMGYLLALTILTTQVGRLGDMFGRVRMYNLGFAIFTIGSLLCGISGTDTELIAFRVVQAVGGALITSNSGAIIADTVPVHQRGRAYGWTGIGWSVGAILGILLGGVLITFINWRAIFLINLPIGIAALAVGLRVLKERSPRIAARIDFLGMLLLGGGLFVVLLSLTNMTGEGITRATELQLGAGVLLLLAFVGWERVVPSPLLPLSLFGYRALTGAVVAAFFQALGSFAVLFLVIMYLQGVRGLSAFNASLLLVPGYLLGGFLGPVSGHMADQRGARLPASLGLVLQAIGVLIYAQLGVSSPLWLVVVAAIVNGAGGSFFYPANNSAVMVEAPSNAFGVANGLLRMLSNVGMVGSFAVALLVASSAIPRAQAFAIFVGVSQLNAGLSAAFVTGMDTALRASLILLAVALVLSLLRGQSRGQRQRLEAAEAAGPGA